jgi:hypothetical protein
MMNMTTTAMTLIKKNPSINRMLKLTMTHPPRTKNAASKKKTPKSASQTPTTEHPTPSAASTNEDGTSR